MLTEHGERNRMLILWIILWCAACSPSPAGLGVDGMSTVDGGGGAITRFGSVDAWNRTTPLPQSGASAVFVVLTGDASCTITLADPCVVTDCTFGNQMTVNAGTITIGGGTQPATLSTSYLANPIGLAARVEQCDRPGADQFATIRCARCPSQGGWTCA